MSKYVYGKPQVERVHGVGAFAEEWIDIRRAKITDAEAMTKQTEQINILASLITDWSICDENGEKVAPSGEALRELPIEITIPALEYFNKIFLPLMVLAEKKSGNSKS